MSVKKFRYKELYALQQDILEQGYDIPVDQDISSLAKPIKVADFTVSNSMAIHPMEGCDAYREGSPSPITLRRYRRFTQGGAGLIWVEATAVTFESRANERQLWLHEGNIEAFQGLMQTILDNGRDEKPYVVLQLTHSGRFSNSAEGPAYIGEHNPYLYKADKQYHILTDRELALLEDEFVKTAVLAKQAGFNAVDIKACHRYLINEMLSCHGRDGIYGGSFENRTRLLLNIVRKIKQQVDIDIAVRMNAFDEIAYPYGFGVDPLNCHVPDFTEAKQLAVLLAETGVSLISVSGATPYYNPHINRPYDIGAYTPPVSQLESIHKLLTAAKAVKTAVPHIPIIACGLSWLREYGAVVAAGGINQGYFDIMGLGRQSFAYPDFANDILGGKGMERKKCCITCSKCSNLMRANSMTGCVVKDSEIYAPLYKNACSGKSFETKPPDEQTSYSS